MVLVLVGVQVVAVLAARPDAAGGGAVARTAVAKKAPAAKTAPAKAPAKKAAPAKTAVARVRKPAAGSQPSAALAAVIGNEAIARPQVVKKLWDYIKANGLQDAKDKRSINADAKLLAVFGKPQITMFELAGIVGKHLG